MNDNGETGRIQHMLVILYVRDQAKSSQFYQHVLDRAPVLDVPGMTEFTLSDECALGLMPGDGVKKLLGDVIEHPFHPKKDIPRAELYLQVENPEIWATRAENAGATVLSPLAERDWGDNVVYLKDFDGNIIALARNT